MQLVCVAAQSRLIRGTAPILGNITEKHSDSTQSLTLHTVLGFNHISDVIMALGYLPVHII